MAIEDEGLTSYQSGRVYDVLVKHAGASELGRSDFAWYQEGGFRNGCIFNGGLGFSGKFCRSGYREREQWYVNGYKEDDTPTRDAMLDATNAALAELVAALVYEPLRLTSEGIPSEWATAYVERPG